jgi:hypothetical protein
MASRTLATTTAKALAARSAFVVLSKPLTSLRQSERVLAALEDFGKVDFFRSAKVRETSLSPC